MIGTQVGSYRITQKLGEGGMGVVYKAVDVDLDREVAMKVLSSDLLKNPDLVARFRAEAKAQANLNHTNLATLYAFMLHEGTAYMVMEFIDGQTFDQMIRGRGPIPEREAIPMFKQALLGVGYAHRAGIIHRDIKTTNLMLNRNGIVKVMDFGISKVMGTRGLTRTGTQMGTVAYMSPEQVRNQNVDIRSDIYELGVTLYEMLTGHLPFESDSDFQVMHDHVNTPPPLPTKYFPYLSKGVEGVVLKSLEKNPDNRFQTVEEFGAALEHPELLGATPAAIPVATAPPPMSAPTAPMGAPPRTVLDSAPPQFTPAPPAGTTPAPTPLASTVIHPSGATAAAGLGTPATAQPHTTDARGTGVSAGGSKQKMWLIVGGVAAILVILIGVGVYRTMSGPTVTTVSSSNSNSNSSGGGSSLALPNVLSSGNSPATPSAPSSTPSSAPSTSSAPSDAAPVAHTAPHPPPSKPVSSHTALTGDQMFQKAQTALASQHFFEPVQNSALYWAIQARKAGNPGGKAIEDQIQEVYQRNMKQYYAQRNYAAALALLEEMQKFYPENTALRAEHQKLQASVNQSKR